MSSTLDSMHFYTKLLTGMVLLLNVGLLVSIRMALKYAKHSSSVDQTERGAALWKSARRGLAILIVLVVCANAAAVYANHRMVNATRELAAELPQGADAELALSFAR